jgi:oligoendopeptidase F
MSDADFGMILELIETFSELTSRLGSYGQLWFSENTQKQGALAFMGRMDQLITEAYNRVLFFDLWWKDLADDAAQRLLAGAGTSRARAETFTVATLYCKVHYATLNQYPVTSR